MADQKISELTAATSGASADLLHVVQGGTNKKLTVQNLLENIAGNLKVAGYVAVNGTPEALAAAGSTAAVSVTSSVTHIASSATTTGVNALTLADGVNGQIKIITMTADAGDVQVDPANFANGTSITFDAVGDTITLLFTNSNWVVLANQNTTIA